MLICGVKLPKGVDALLFKPLSMLYLNEKVRYVCKEWSMVVDAVLALRLKRMDLWKCSGIDLHYCTIQALLQYPRLENCSESAVFLLKW